MRRRGRITLIPLLLVGAFVVFQYFTSEEYTNPETGRSARVALSSAEETALGVQAYREVLSGVETIERGPQYEMVRRIAERLARQTGEAASDFAWEVSLVQSPEVNAFCLPGGKIVVYSGIVDVAQTEAGLAAVIGHEMAHAIARHGSQRLLRQNLTQTVLVGVSMSLGELDYQQRQLVMAALGAGAQYGVVLPFSRGHETEADRMGLLYMARAGYDPEAAISFWQRMSEAGGAQPPEFASTHPSHETRIEDLRAFMPEAIEAYRKAIEGRGDDAVEAP